MLGALNERRVEMLLLEPGAEAPGCTCPQCGSVWPLNGGACPADGAALDYRSNVVESAVELALVQSAEVLVVRDEDHRRELQSHGDIARRAQVLEADPPRAPRGAHTPHSRSPP